MQTCRNHADLSGNKVFQRKNRKQEGVGLGVSGPARSPVWLEQREKGRAAERSEVRGRCQTVAMTRCPRV